jgi:hypothetical protein
MTEKEIENYYADIIQMSSINSEALKEMKFAKNYTTSSESLFDLIGKVEFQFFQDTTDWNNNKEILVDISGNMIPDLVIRSKRTNQNRILIEIKNESNLRYGIPDSQAVRYFLNLIATSTENKNGDIKRGIILIAPPKWFSNSKWCYFTKTYSDLAKVFGITIAEIKHERNTLWK